MPSGASGLKGARSGGAGSGSSAGGGGGRRRRADRLGGGGEGSGAGGVGGSRAPSTRAASSTGVTRLTATAAGGGSGRTRIQGSAQSASAIKAAWPQSDRKRPRHPPHPRALGTGARRAGVLGMAAPPDRSAARDRGSRIRPPVKAGALLRICRRGAGSARAGLARPQAMPHESDQIRAEVGMGKRTASVLVAAGLAALTSLAAWAQQTERCYGVALAGQNDGIGGGEAPGQQHGRLPGRRLGDGAARHLPDHAAAGRSPTARRGAGRSSRSTATGPDRPQPPASSSAGAGQAASAPAA